MMNVDAEFLTSATAGTFMNTTFGWPGWTAADLPGGGPAYPLSSPGVRVKVAPAPEGIYAQAAVFSGDPTGHSGSNSPDTLIPSGTEISFTGGVFAIGEVGYAVNQAKDAKGPPMMFKLGGWYASSTHFQDQQFSTDGLSLADPASNGMPQNHTGNWGFYGVADAALYQPDDGPNLSGFMRLGGGSPSDRNLVTLYIDAGLTSQGLIPTRDNDTAGIAIAYAKIGSSARGLDQNTQVFTNDPFYPVRSEEIVLEATYQAQLTPWLTLQPDIQYIINPAGKVLNANGSIRANALVLGLRSAITF
jgi:porin